MNLLTSVREIKLKEYKKAQRNSILSHVFNEN